MLRPCLLASLLVAGCASTSPLAPVDASTAQPNADTFADTFLQPLIAGRTAPHILLLGEQHDAPQHQQLERDVVRLLLRHGRLAALALEMAEQGKSTAGLQTDASDAQVQAALGWNEAGWPWAAYGPAIMLAVREGVPVLGANLPRNQQRDAMRNSALDARLTIASLQKQQDLIEASHCGLLAATQLRPMTRIQIARDKAMADTLVQAMKRTPPLTPEQRSSGPPLVLLLAGSGHADRALGVPQHLPPQVKIMSIRLQAMNAGPVDEAQPFDAVWPTVALQPKDYCAELRASMQAQPKP
jgi:uncharacterized iron-regulated protein